MAKKTDTKSKKTTTKSTTGKSASTGKGATTGKASGTTQQAQAPLNVISQYIKDFSFENPGALASLSSGNKKPDINIHVETNAEKVKGSSDRLFEVSLKIKVDAKKDGGSVFLLEVDYAGLFEIGSDVPEEYLRPIIMVECPRILFPFARSIVANSIQDGGYPALLITPVDFAGLYQQQMLREKDAQSKKTGTK